MVPTRRLPELSRYGVEGKVNLLRRHGDSRRAATLLALSNSSGCTSIARSSHRGPAPATTLALCQVRRCGVGRFRTRDGDAGIVIGDQAVFRR